MNGYVEFKADQSWEFEVTLVLVNRTKVSFTGCFTEDAEDLIAMRYTGRPSGMETILVETSTGCWSKGRSSETRSSTTELSNPE